MPEETMQTMPGSQAPAPEQPEKSGNAAKITAIVLGVLLVLALIAAGYFWMQVGQLRGQLDDAQQQLSALQDQNETLAMEVEEMEGEMMEMEEAESENQPSRLGTIGFSFVHPVGWGASVVTPEMAGAYFDEVDFADGRTIYLMGESPLNFADRGAGARRQGFRIEIESYDDIESMDALIDRFVEHDEMTSVSREEYTNGNGAEFIAVTGDVEAFDDTFALTDYYLEVDGTVYRFVSHIDGGDPELKSLIDSLALR